MQLTPPPANVLLPVCAAAGVCVLCVAAAAVAVQVWNIMDVLNVLQALVDKSGIVGELERDGGAELTAAEGYIPNQSNVLKMLGYFSLIGQLRVRRGGGRGRGVV